MNLEIDGEQAVIHNIWYRSKVLPSLEPCQNPASLTDHHHAKRQVDVQ
jgi:hypothetical protein